MQKCLGLNWFMIGSCRGCGAVLPLTGRSAIVINVKLKLDILMISSQSISKICFHVKIGSVRKILTINAPVVLYFQ